MNLSNSFSIAIIMLFFSCSDQTDSGISENDAEVERIPITAVENIAASEFEINQFVKLTDSLYENNKLKKIEYHEMSLCGGALAGYTLGDSIMFLSGLHAVGFSHTISKCYFKDSILYKTITTTHYTTNEEDSTIYNNDGKIEPSLLKYSNEIVTILYTEEPKMIKTIDGEETSHHIDTWNNIIEHKRQCASEMRFEILSELKNLR
ncbi:hypothetical protein K6119_09755 [Paracrocinitomix mangrovi]|uniref:hypothetical protein n=1 Tax=Paracrocinitomix mangrovi TaxID=2862509 RepID=UPI001C8DC3C9|nr:hypothetical protein [Paracrocinitomix mangrovi]UKN03774.1 hypothetical protein K6119_09755 [Paracrocinitomix mangrovi]